MDIRGNIEALMASGISAYRVAKEAGIPNNTVVRLFSGESSLDNIRFALAEKLSDYYAKVENEMETYVIDYGAGNTEEVTVIDVEKAKEIAFDGMSYTQHSVWIRDNNGNDVAVSHWYGTAPSEEDEALCEIGGGHYANWWDL